MRREGFGRCLCAIMALSCGVGSDGSDGVAGDSEDFVLARAPAGLPSAFRVVRHLELEETERVLVSRPTTYLGSGYEVPDLLLNRRPGLGRSDGIFDQAAR